MDEMIYGFVRGSAGAVRKLQQARVRGSEEVMKSLTRLSKYFITITNLRQDIIVSRRLLLLTWASLSSLLFFFDLIKKP